MLALTLGHMSFSQAAPGWREEANVYTRLYDAPLRFTNGDSMTMLQLANKHPLVIGLVFSKCAGVCYPMLRQLKTQVERHQPKTDFTVLILSFDPEDGIDDMRQMAERYGLEGKAHWRFATTTEIDPLIVSIGFIPVRNDTMRQYDHEALLVGVNTDGYLAKKLIGMRDQEAFDLLIKSIHNQFAPTYRLPTSGSLFSCFNYDPVTGKNKPGLGLLLIALPALLSVMLLLSIRLIVHQKQERKAGRT